MSNLGVAKNGLGHDAESRTSRCTPAAEDYLRAIYGLTMETAAPAPFATTSAIAERLEVRPASVTAMLQKLAAATPAMVDYHKSHGARLTAAGERSALAVVRRHRLLECFLHDRLGYAWDEVHDEADRLEHVISPDLAARLAATLGEPTHDPHGHAIPAADLSLPPAALIPVRDLKAGRPAVVRCVSDDDGPALRRLAAAGVRPGARVAVTARQADGVLVLRVAGAAAVALPDALARRVFVALSDAGDWAVDRAEPKAAH